MEAIKHKIDYHHNEIRKVTIIGMIINLCLSIIKFIVGIIGSSQAVIADAFHSLSDLATDFVIILGIKYWSAPPDEEHPYGHLRIEALITVIIGVALAAVALGLGYKSLASIKEIHTRKILWVAVIGPALSIIVKEYLYQWTIIVGKRAKSQAVIANAWHHRSDVLSSIPAVLAVIVSAINPKLAYIDNIAALIIALFILKVSWNIIAPSLLELVDRGASLKDNHVIKKIALNTAGVKNVHAIRTRRFGVNLQVDLHILVDPDISVRQGHDISEQVKHELISKGPNILDVVVHLEPYESPGNKE